MATMRKKQRYRIASLSGEAKFEALQTSLFPLEKGDLPEAQDYWRAYRYYRKNNLHNDAAFYLSMTLHLDALGYSSRVPVRYVKLCPRRENLLLQYKSLRIAKMLQNGNRSREALPYFLADFENGFSMLNPTYNDSLIPLGMSYVPFFSKIKFKTLLTNLLHFLHICLIAMYFYNIWRNNMSIEIAHTSAFNLLNFVKGRKKLNDSENDILQTLKRYSKKIVVKKDFFDEGMNNIIICNDSDFFQSHSQPFIEGILMLRFSCLKEEVQIDSLRVAIVYLKTAVSLHPEVSQDSTKNKTYSRIAIDLMLALGTALYSKVSGISWNNVFDENHKAWEIDCSEKMVDALESRMWIQRVAANVQNDTILTVLLSNITQATFKFDGKNQFGHIYNVQHRRARQIKTPSEKDLLSLVPSGDHPWFTLQRKYLLRHLHLIEKASTPGALLQSDIRVVVAKLDVVGIGNQLVQIISTLLFAMLTNRTLLIQKVNDFENSYFYTAGNNIDAYHQHFQFPGGFSNEKGLTHGWVDFLELVVGSENASVLASSLSSSRYRMQAEWYLQDKDFVEALACGEDLDEALGTVEKPIIFIHSNLHFLSLLEQNPSYYDKLVEVFEGNIFGRLSKFFIKPSLKVNEIIQKFEKENFQGKSDSGLIKIPFENQSTPMHARPWLVEGLGRGGKGGGTLIVGFHLRTGIKSHSVDRNSLWHDDSIISRIIRDAAMNLRKAINRERNSPVPSGVKNFEKVTVFVAGDTMKGKMELVKRLRSMKDVIDNVVYYDAGRGATRTADGMQSAVVDMMLLSKSHVLFRAGKQFSLYTNVVEGLMQNRFGPVYYSESQEDYSLYPAGQRRVVAIMESSIEGHGDDLGMCYGGRTEYSSYLREIGVLYPNEVKTKNELAFWSSDAIQIVTEENNLVRDL
eukprot:g4943.t1